MLKYKIPPAHVLELGAAHGGFVWLLRLAGYEATGVELSPWVVDFGQKTFGIPMLRGPLEALDLPLESFDVIAHMDVLEHLPDPETTMAHCLGLLKPSGLMLIQTPCYRGESHEQLVAEGDPFLRMLRSRGHLFLFSEESLRLLFSRLGAREVIFEMARFEHDMFAIVSRQPITTVPAEVQREILDGSGIQRAAGALLDLHQRCESFEKVCDDRKAMIAALQDQLKEKKDAIQKLEIRKNELGERLQKEKVRQQKLAARSSEKVARLESELKDLKRNVLVRMARRLTASLRKRRKGLQTLFHGKSRHDS
jgi:SAM-dependent methyltransferase